MIGWLRRAMRAVEGVVWPKRLICLLCEERVDDGVLCRECAGRLSNQRLTGQTGAVRSAYKYAAEAATLVKALKYDAMADAAKLLAEAIAEEAREMALPPDTVITWVAMPAYRRRSRGIDHGRKLCTSVGELLGLPVCDLLVRTRRTRTQRGLNKARRLTNLQGVFASRRAVTTPVLLIDDVMTTGTTVRLCSEVLIRAGAPQVYAVTATRVRSRTDDNDRI